MYLSYTEIWNPTSTTITTTNNNEQKTKANDLSCVIYNTTKS